MSHRRPARPQCSHANCGSRRLHRGDDGFLYCGQGHQQADLGALVAEDTGELVKRGKTTRRKGSDAESGTTRVSGFSGAQAFEHYLLCVQLVLRKQLGWLVEVQGLPGELETLVKDLWTLRLQKLQSKVSYDSETETEAASSAMFSSQSEGESGTDPGSAASLRSKLAARKAPKSPSLTDLLCLIYTGILLLRIPLTVADLHRWINSGELLYYRATHEVPLSMRDRLPGTYQDLLEPQSLISPDTLQSSVLDLLAQLNADFGMEVPPINHSLILYRWVTELRLPLEVYIASQRLGRLLVSDYCFTLDAERGTSAGLRYPEVRLMAQVIVATKLFFPFDNQKRYSASSNDFSTLKMDWEAWSDMHDSCGEGRKSPDRSENLTFQDAFTMDQARILNLAGERLDDYLDWYESSIASEEVRERGRAGRDADFRRALFRLFPTQREHRDQPSPADSDRRQAGEVAMDRARQIQGALRPRRIVQGSDSDDVPFAGSSHIQYKGVEDLEGTSRVFYDKAAQLAGFPLIGMVRAVFSMERKLMKHERDLREGCHPRQSSARGQSLPASSQGYA